LPKLGWERPCRRDRVHLGLFERQFEWLSLFDTGTPYMAFDVPQGTVFPGSIEPNSQVQITLSSGFVYSYTSGAIVAADSVGPYSTLVNAGVANSLAETIVGVDYFTQHGFFIDYSASQEGWK
jgi:hypothetical protein